MKTIQVLAAGAASVFWAAQAGAAEEENAFPVFKGSAVIEEGSRLRSAGSGFEFTEGPARDAQGNVYFTDQPNDRIHHWSAETGKISVFLEPSGRSNGLFVAQDGDLVACADEKNELWRIAIKSAEPERLLGSYGGHRLNGPNDVWVLPNGDLYFTDPFYKRPYWSHDSRDQDGQHVYFLKKGAENAVRVTQDLVQPNGIVGDAAKGHLYVADIGGKKTYRYDIADNGRLSAKTEVIGMGSDGMTLDERGNLYLTGKGVTVVSPDGERIQHIPVPEGWTANVCFAGKDRRRLFITAMDSVYTLKMKVAGAPGA